jgi:tight adherence protein C
MNTLSVITLLAYLLLSTAAWSQSDCQGEFSDISVSCITNTDKNFSDKPKPISSLLPGAILFYKTPGGEFGKMKILSVTNKPEKAGASECTVYLDAITYSNNGSFIPNSSLSIKPNQNHWLEDKIYLDREGLSALTLEKVSPEQLDKRRDEEALKRYLNKNKLTESSLEKSSPEQINKIIDDEIISAGGTPPKRLLNSEQEALKSKASCILGLTKGAEFAVFKPGTIEEKGFKDTSRALFWAPLFLIFVAIFIIVRVFMEDQDKYKTQEALEEAENSTKGKEQAFFIKVTKPFYKRYFLPIVQGSKHKQNFRTKYRQKLANAGLMKDMSPEEFVAMKFFMIIGGPFAFLTVRWIMSETWSLSFTPLMGIIGYFYPDIWLSGMIKKRADEVLRAMPFIIDMLALSVEAGLDFMAAIQRVIEKAPDSPLVEEFETLIKETKIGSSRAEGLRQLGWRVNIIEINSFCATLIAADSVGASIAPLLKQLSSELRVKRSSRAEQQGATAATKILIPMIFFILPAVLVAIFAPMLLKMMSGKL